MEIKKTATAGTLESSDAYVVAEPFDTLEVDLTSVVYEQFKDEIISQVKAVTDALGVSKVKITINDRGAVDCVIRARVETALKRAGGEM